MFFAELAVLLSTCYNIANCFSLHGHGDGLNFLFKEFDKTVFQLDPPEIETKWMSQPLDHFDAHEKRTWKMRYFKTLEFWKPGGPIYLFMNGEARAEKYFLQAGIMYELANETKGAMFLSEHRYYGDSKPFENFTTENLQFLSSRQALADNARLLDKIKLLPPFNRSKVVVIGGSYSGNLAAWMKLLYPDLVDAVIASSAPVLAKTDFYEYLETVSDDFEQFCKPGCFDKIRQIFKQYEDLLKTDDGIKQLKAEENICQETDMNKLENRQLYFMDKTSVLMEVAQYGSVASIQKQCQEIDNSSHIISSKNNEIGLWNVKEQCYDYDFDNAIESFKSTDWVMSWIYQTCTEFGYYQTTNSKNHPFTNNIPVEFYYKMCTATFGSEFDEKRVKEGITKTNLMYGGLKPNVTNVVFVNGDLDPWHRLGILEDVSNDAPAKRIPFSSHCRDLFPDKSGDPDELKEARKYIKYLVKKWIGTGEFVMH